MRIGTYGRTEKKKRCMLATTAIVRHKNQEHENSFSYTHVNERTERKSISLIILLYCMNFSSQKTTLCFTRVNNAHLGVFFTVC